jgi:hypothetical protein
MAQVAGRKSLKNMVTSPYEHWKPLTDSQFYGAMGDFVQFCKESIILDKNGRPVPMHLNEAQVLFSSEVLKAIEPIMKKIPTKSVNVLCHKSRQMGITTVTLKLEQFVASKSTNFNILHVMPTDSEANEMIDRKFLPLLRGTHPELLADIVPVANYADFKSFSGIELDNRITFMSAGVKSSGHGRTIHMLVEDEHAKYTDPFNLEAGLLPAMSGNTIRIVLFTAKGMNHSFDLSKVAQDPESDWVYIFLPWYILSEYEMEPEGRYKSLNSLTEYDLFLCSEFKRAGISPSRWARKLQWYNYTFINEAKKDQLYMFENYPTVAAESFQASGAPIFDSRLLYDWMEREFKTIDAFYADGETRFDYVDGGAIKEYEAPIKNHQYIIGLDPAEGEVKGDDSALVVWDITKPKIKAVAAYNGIISQNDFAELAYDMAMRYNMALLVPERNMGSLMIKWLTEVKGYLNIWTDANKVTGYNNLGVRTTVSSKNEMIARLKFLMNNGYYEDFDPVFCEQGLYFTFQKTASGQLRAAGDSGHHDDAVLARMLCTMAINMDRYKGYTKTIQKEGRKYGR